MRYNARAGQKGSKNEHYQLPFKKKEKGNSETYFRLWTKSTKSTETNSPTET